MEQEPKYVGTPKDVVEMTRHLFPLFKERIQQGQREEASGIIKLQTEVTREIIFRGGEQTTQ